MPDEHQTQTEAAREAVAKLCELVAEMDKIVAAFGDRYGAAYTTGALLFLTQGLLALAEDRGLALDAKLCCSILCRHCGVTDAYPETLARAEGLLAGAGEA